ncbi:MAG: ATP-dependent RecD-like DNA helicase [Firmicutes bacterium]|nr:ATP-dependent RecD-like DNA helicase [Bacillota bacterium]
MIQLDGTVERITFYNENNYYTVAKLKLDSGKIVTIVGNLPPLYYGEELSLKGVWTQHKEYGEQFQIEEWESKVPQTLTGIERFLGSGLLKGVGPATAKKIVRHFGLDSLTVIEKNPEQLLTIPGFTLNKADRIAESLREHGEVQKIMVFLQGLGVSPGYALKIYQAYLHEAVKVVKENPYRLADDIFGIGFKIADQIAHKIGINNDSPYRIQAGIRFWLNENSADGHIYANEKDFVTRTAKELEVAAARIENEIEAQLQRKELFREKAPDGGNALYTAPFYYSEVGVATRLKNMIEAAPKPVRLNSEKILEKFAADHQITLAVKQREAVLKSLESGLLVITGGPGTGKTTIVKAILSLFKAAGLRVMLAAPTGRAAKRLAETTLEKAKTIHRLLGYGNEEFGGSQFQYNEDEPLATDVLIVDEFSMVDLILFYNLLKAITPGTRLIMVGDVDQLPSVGPGSVLRDLIQSNRVPTVKLNVIFRQAEESLIVGNAHRINRGEFPFFSRERDFFFIEEANPEAIARLIPELVKTRLPGYLNCDAFEDIQVLTPMRRTVTGVENLNLCLQEALNPPDPDKSEIKTGTMTFRQGDKVMQIKNDYQKLVFNGDIGRISEIDPEDRRLTVNYPEVDGEREVGYETEDLDQLTLSYAITIHKSQGNEYPVVIVPITTQHFLMLQRNLLYTAVTRAKKMVVLIGTKKAIAIAVKNNKIEERNSLLRLRLENIIPIQPQSD